MNSRGPLGESLVAVPPPLGFIAEGAKKSTGSQTGALVISLDFELHWGVRDHAPLDKEERSRLLKARAGIPRLLDLFEEFSVHATWATVGLLFARSKEEAEAFRPRKEPTYQDGRLNPYNEQLGDSESQDPFHFAPSLIADISRRRGQEIGSHSYSHYYCLEGGQTEEEFEADLQSAVAIAKSAGCTLRSYVFPRNQVRPSYLGALKRAGILTYRDNEPVATRKASSFAGQRRPDKRIVRLLDTYLNINGPLTVAWPVCSELVSVPASRYFRAYRPAFARFEPYLLRRITGAMKHAAEHAEVFHLWWHPEDLALHFDRNLRALRSLLEQFAEHRRRHGMLSHSMAELAGQIRPAVTAN